MNSDIEFCNKSGRGPRRMTSMANYSDTISIRCQTPQGLPIHPSMWGYIDWCMKELISLACKRPKPINTRMVLRDRSTFIPCELLFVGALLLSFCLQIKNKLSFNLFVCIYEIIQVVIVFSRKFCMPPTNNGPSISVSIYLQINYTC